MIPCEVLFRVHLDNSRSIYMLVSVRGIVGGLGDVL